MFVSYGAIQFQVSKTNDLLCEAVYSEDGVDYLYTRVRIDVEGLLNPYATSYSSPVGSPIPTQGILPGLTHISIRHILLQPREYLLITDFNDQVVIEAPNFNPAGYTDVYNGPKPLSCSVRQVIGSRTWVIRWVCEAYIIECPSYKDNPIMLSNRWSETHTINQYHLTTRTISGKMVFRRDLLDAEDNVARDFFNTSIVPDVLPGFQREAIDISVSTNGLELNYRIIEREKMYDKGETDATLGGSGIVRIDGAFGMTSVSSKDGPAAGNSIAQIDIRAYGNRYSNQFTMISRCFQLILSKLQLRRPPGEPIGWVQHAAIRESLGEDEKWVEVSVAYYQTPGTVSVKFEKNGEKITLPRFDPLAVDVGDLFADNLGSNPNMPDGTWGTARSDQLKQALQNACESRQKPPTPYALPRNGPPPSSGPPPAINTVPYDPSFDPNRYNPSPDVKNEPYTRYRSSIEYEIHSGTMIAPTTGPPPGGSFSGGSGGTGTMAGSGPNSPSWSWPASIFQVSSPLGIMRVSFSAERMGAVPTLPTLTPNDPNLTLHMYRIRPDGPPIWNDGETPVYSINGFYEFFMSKVPGLNDNLAMGIIPWSNLSFTETIIRPSDFGEDLYEYSPVDGGSGGSIGTST